MSNQLPMSVIKESNIFNLQLKNIISDRDSILLGNFMENYVEETWDRSKF